MTGETEESDQNFSSEFEYEGLGAIPAFIAKLWEMAENSKLKIVTWNADGTAIQLHLERKDFSRCLKHFFKTKSPQSFIRQLNMYNFKKVKFFKKKNYNNFQF